MLFANIPLLPERASSHAWDIDLLFWFITAVTGAATILVYALLAYFCAKYRRQGPNDQTPRILGSHKLEIFWSAVPLVIFLFIFAWGVWVFDQVYQVPPDAEEIWVVGKQWMWKVQREDGTREINEIHLLINKPVKLTFISEDVIHSWGIPVFRDKIDVLPGRYVTTWYTPTKTGKFHLFCDQLCGVGHSKMIGSVHVMEEAEFREWKLGKRPTEEGPTDGSLAWEGRKLFMKLQCSSCHNARGGRAPLLEGIWHTTIPLKDGGTAYVDEAYIRESILKPKTKVHQGWDPIMPTFEQQLADKSLDLTQEEAMIRLIAFIKTLGRDQTPQRTEQFPPPIGAETDPGKLPKEGSKK